ncbi:MAG: hypothetical protein OZ917_01745 [Candidatus Brocadiaceae bacterium]|nr:hypothetical protein [Candidatus Brocadiaceae bacterium]
MTFSLKELETWFQDRPKWLQDAARRLIQNGTLTEQDYTDLLTLCIQEATGQAVTFSGIPSGALGVVDATKPLRLESISDVQGINALSPSKPLLFGKVPLCIVYGRNGAGKSGYVRLLKHACGARRPGALIGNIFNSTIQPKTAKLTYIEDTQTKTSLWNGTPISELQGVEIYDTACGLVYVNDENEVAFEPWLLRLFTQLTEASTTLSQCIKKQVEGLASKKPIFPTEFVTTTSAAWYTNLTAHTTKQEVDEKVAWIHEHETELTDVNKRLAEPNPVAKAVALRRQKNLVLELTSELKKPFKGLSDELCNAFLQIRKDAATKRKTADEDAKKVFEKAPLTGVGSETWRILWDVARRYSEEYAYKAHFSPILGKVHGAFYVNENSNRTAGSVSSPSRPLSKANYSGLRQKRNRNFSSQSIPLPMCLSPSRLPLKWRQPEFQTRLQRRWLLNLHLSLHRDGRLVLLQIA